MSQALYRKYRSRTLDEVVGQEHIKQTIKNALKKGVIGHAYLFTGPKGVGKTSIARILAHEINGLKYDTQKTHLDIIEIDAASNRRIDEIRDLRDKVHIAPTSSKYKVYIIDEVHMLTKEAFNALLKTLEEPPAHVIFILATTELNKLPETIISRTQHFSFTPISINDIVSHLTFIAEQEGLKLDKDAAQLIAEHSDGSFRDSIGLLDKLRSFDEEITINTTKSLLGIAPDEVVDKVLEETFSGNPKTLLTNLQNMYAEGYSGSTLLSQLITKVRDLLIAQPSKPLLELYKQLTQTNIYTDAQASLEIALLEFQSHSFGEQPQVVTQPTIVEEPTQIEPSPVSPIEPPTIEIEVPINIEESVDSGTDDLWENVLGEIKKHHNTLYGIVRMAKPKFESGTLHLQFRFPFHLKQITESKNNSLIQDIVDKSSGSNIKIVCELVGQAEKSENTKPTNDLKTINNIFGQSEMLES